MSVDQECLISVLLSARVRPDKLRRLLVSLRDTAASPKKVEVVFYVDEADAESRALVNSGVTAVCGPRCGMGEMVRACYDASRGRYLLLLDDDYRFATRGWDELFVQGMAAFGDDLGLVWADDGIQGGRMATAPCISREFCQLIGGPCPAEYTTGFVDAHLFDIFVTLRLFGVDRMRYLPEVLIEHLCLAGEEARRDEKSEEAQAALSREVYFSQALRRVDAAKSLARRIKGLETAQEAPSPRHCVQAPTKAAEPSDRPAFSIESDVPDLVLPLYAALSRQPGTAALFRCYLPGTPVETVLQQQLAPPEAEGESQADAWRLGLCLRPWVETRAMLAGSFPGTQAHGLVGFEIEDQAARVALLPPPRAAFILRVTAPPGLSVSLLTPRLLAAQADPRLNRRIRRDALAAWSMLGNDHDVLALGDGARPTAFLAACYRCLVLASRRPSSDAVVDWKALAEPSTLARWVGRLSGEVFDEAVAAQILARCEPLLSARPSLSEPERGIVEKMARGYVRRVEVAQGEMSEPLSVKKTPSAASRPKVSVILLDWSVRERFHALTWLARQTVAREDYEIIWVELYRRVPAEALSGADQVITLGQRGIYHKHQGYNAGLLAARGDIVTICDSDAVFPAHFIESILERFGMCGGAEPQALVLMHHEWRTKSLHPYPDGLERLYPEGLRNVSDMRKYGEWLPLAPNVGACVSVRRRDALGLGGCDEDESLRGLVCGPYDLAWRLVNVGLTQQWEQEAALWHFAHNNSDQQMDSSGRSEITFPQINGHALASMEALVTGRIMPLKESPEILAARFAQRLAGSEVEQRLSTFSGPPTQPPAEDVSATVREQPFRPRRLKSTEKPQALVSIILLDWGCRESFHALEWLARQDVPRELYEIIWVELYGEVAPKILRAADTVLALDQQGLYHKHKGYNAGLLASRGDIVTVCDSDAVFPRRFVRTILEAFYSADAIVGEVAQEGLGPEPQSLVLMHHERRTDETYPPALAEDSELAQYAWKPLWPNAGACVSMPRRLVFGLGGYDEAPSLAGYLCGPYDLAWRAVNAGVKQVWHPDEDLCLWHFAHPHASKVANDEQWQEMIGGHVEWHALPSVQAFASGAVIPQVENEEVATQRLAQRRFGSELEASLSDSSAHIDHWTTALDSLDDLPDPAYGAGIVSRLTLHCPELLVGARRAIGRYCEVRSDRELVDWLHQLAQDRPGQARFKQALVLVVLACGDSKRALDMAEGDPAIASVMVRELIRLGLCDRLRGLGEVAQAMRARTDNPAERDALTVIIVRTHLEAGSIDAAREALASLEDMPEHPVALAELAHCLVACGLPERVKRVARLAIRNNPSNPAVVLRACRAMALAGWPEEAADLLDWHSAIWKRNPFTVTHPEYPRVPLLRSELVAAVERRAGDE